MKKILFMLPILAVALVSCNKDNGDELSGDDIIQFNDPNFLKVLLVEQEIPIYDAATDEFISYTMNVDTNNDGQISVAEAEEVIGLGLYDDEIFFNISDISEIKYFTALQFLECHWNQLTKLDLSNNTALTYLDCSTNKLTTLDISANTALQYVYCGDNPLQTLIISKSQLNTEWLDDVKAEYPDIEIQKK